MSECEGTGVCLVVVLLPCWCWAAMVFGAPPTKLYLFLPLHPSTHLVPLEVRVQHEACVRVGILEDQPLHLSLKHQGGTAEH